MLLQVYVSHVQIAAFGYPALSVNAEIPLSLVGSPGSTLGAEVLALDCFSATDGRRTMTRTGLAEYAFQGRVLEVRERQDEGKIVYQEVLLDCGVPIVFATHGYRGFIPIFDITNPSNKETQPGRFLSGLLLLSAHISPSFRDPVLIKREIKARVKSIMLIDLLPNSVSLAASIERQSLDSASAQLPVILEIEVQSAQATP